MVWENVSFYKTSVFYNFNQCFEQTNEIISVLDSFIPWMFCGNIVSREMTASVLKVVHYHHKTFLIFWKWVLLPCGPTVKTDGARNTILRFYISWPVISHFSLLFLEKYNSLFLFRERFEDSSPSQSLFIRINSVLTSSPRGANINFLKKNPAYGRQSISRPMRIVAPIPQ